MSLLLTLVTAGCAASTHRAGTGPTQVSALSGCQTGVLRVSDLSPGWTVQSDTLPNGLTINNGGPIGRQQAPNLVKVGDTTGLVTIVSKEFGDGNGSRAWDMVVAGSPSGLGAAYERVTANGLGFAGVMETEAIEAYPNLSSGQGGSTDYGRPSTARIDLGSYGTRTWSQRVSTTIVHNGQPRPVTLDVAMAEMPKCLLFFGFLSSPSPPSLTQSQHVVQAVASRLS